MKSKKLLLMAAAILLTVSGCAAPSGEKTDSEKTAATVESTGSESTGTTLFTDSAGREVEVPEKITKIAPSGMLAQLVLYTNSPDLLVGLATPFSKDAQPYIDEKYQELPEFGQFYGKNASLNMEALSAAEPDVIIDIGEAKETVKEDMDSLQEQLQIPVVFIEASLENLPETYRVLGELLGETDETEQLSSYCQTVLDQAAEVRADLSESDRKTVYFATGDTGLNTNAEGSFHAQVIETTGAANAAAGVEVTSSGGGTIVSMEQLLQWQPDYILADSEAVYKLIQSDEAWQELSAVKNEHVYQVPNAPYNFMGSPPSVNRILGIQWLGQLVYPEKYKTNAEEAVKEFYQLFYHTEPSEEQLSAILKNAV